MSFNNGDYHDSNKGGCFFGWNFFLDCMAGTTQPQLHHNDPWLPAEGFIDHKSLLREDNFLGLTVETTLSSSSDSTTTTAESSTSSLMIGGGSSPSRFESLLSPRSKEAAWERIEDQLYVTLNGRSDHLHLFRELHDAGLVKADILKSLAFLASKPLRHNAEYDDNIDVVASFLSKRSAKLELKVHSVRVLFTCLTPEEFAWQLRESVIVGTFEFLTKPDVEWEFMEHSEMMLLWELRAVCLKEMKREKVRVEQVADAGDTAVSYISISAAVVEEGLSRSVPVIGGKLDSAGVAVKDYVKTNDTPLMTSGSAVVAMTISDAAKRASGNVHGTSKTAIDGIRDASSRGIVAVSKKLEDGKIGEKLIPHAQSREVLKAAGKVGMASIGAAAIIGEAVVDTTRAVAGKTASVTADVIEHKYGTTAGQVVRDAGDTAGNLIKTLGNVAMLETKILVKSVAKQNGKTQVKKEVERAQESVRLLEQQTKELFRSIQQANNEAAGTASRISSPERKTKVNDSNSPSRRGSTPSQKKISEPQTPTSKAERSPEKKRRNSAAPPVTPVTPECSSVASPSEQSTDRSDSASSSYDITTTTTTTKSKSTPSSRRSTTKERKSISECPPMPSLKPPTGTSKSYRRKSTPLALSYTSPRSQSSEQNNDLEPPELSRRQSNGGESTSSRRRSSASTRSGKLFLTPDSVPSPSHAKKYIQSPAGSASSKSRRRSSTSSRTGKLVLTPDSEPVKTRRSSRSKLSKSSHKRDPIEGMTVPNVMMPVL